MYIKEIGAQRTVTRSFIGVAAVGLVLTTAALPASASAGPALSTHAAASAGINSAPAPIAGYDITPGAVTKGSVQFKVPAVTCLPTTTQGFALGLGVENTSGSPTTLGDVFVACLNGAAYYQLDVLANGVAATDSTNVFAHDVIKVSYVAGGTLTVTAVDVSTATTVTATGPAPSDTNITFGAFPLFAGGPALDAPKFKPAKLTKIKVNGLTPAAGAVSLANGNPHMIVGPMALPGAGGKFKLKYT